MLLLKPSSVWNGLFVNLYFRYKHVNPDEPDCSGVDGPMAIPRDFEVFHIK